MPSALFMKKGPTLVFGIKEFDFESNGLEREYPHGDPGFSLHFRGEDTWP